MHNDDDIIPVKPGTFLYARTATRCASWLCIFRRDNAAIFLITKHSFNTNTTPVILVIDSAIQHMTHSNEVSSMFKKEIFDVVIET